MANLQDRIYAFIKQYIVEHGISPTIRNIGDAMGIKSTSHIDYLLDLLVKSGRIVREDGVARSIRPIQKGIRIDDTTAAGLVRGGNREQPEFLRIDRWFQDESIFALLVRGESMIEDYISDGDYVLIKAQPEYRNGDAVVALHKQSGTEGGTTLKRFYREQDHIRLQPANSTMEPIVNDPHA